MNRQEEYEIDLLKLVATLWSKILLIILSAVIVGILVFGATYLFIEPTYQATASIYVNNSSLSLGSTSISISSSELTTSNRLVSTYIYILRSRTTLEDVIAEANLPYGYQRLRGMLVVSPVENTAAIDITVVCGSPTEAELIANTIATVLPRRISEIVDGSSVRIVDYAIVPSSRSGPNFTRNTLFGFMAGAALAIAIIALQFIIDERNDYMIHSADALRQMYPDIPVLALIPDMRYTEKKKAYYYYSSYYGDTKDGKGA